MAREPVPQDCRQSGVPATGLTTKYALNPMGLKYALNPMAPATCQIGRRVERVLSDAGAKGLSAYLPARARKGHKVCTLSLSTIDKPFASLYDVHVHTAYSARMYALPDGWEGSEWSTPSCPPAQREQSGVTSPKSRRVCG